MNQRIQLKIEEYKKLAANYRLQPQVSTRSITNREDSLTTVIRSKKDADDFMAELDSIARRSR